MVQHGESSAAAGPAAGAPTAHDLFAETRQVGEAAAAVAVAAAALACHTRALVRWQLERRPYATLAAAAAVGCVLGGGIPPALWRPLLRAGGRLAVERALAGLVAATPRSL